MLPRVHRRSVSAVDVLRHLFGPGDHGEHRNPRVVGAWPMATATGDVDDLRTAPAAGGAWLRRLAELLEQPVVAGVNPPVRPVWHCTLQNHPDDPVLSDQQWAQIAAQFLAAVRLAPEGDLDAVRWLAIRNGDDHVHVVATLVRQDGPTVWIWNDYHIAQAAARELEVRHGLYRVRARSRATRG